MGLDVIRPYAYTHSAYTNGARGAWAGDTTQEAPGAWFVRDWRPSLVQHCPNLDHCVATSHQKLPRRHRLSGVGTHLLPPPSIYLST